MSLPARVAWIEIRLASLVLLAAASLPARVAWIEMETNELDTTKIEVATREGSVD